MYDTISSLIGLLPFSWAQYSFMQNALLAILAVVPLFTLLGAMVVNNQMAFFSDTLGHSALTGIALGVIAGLHNPPGPADFCGHNRHGVTRSKNAPVLP